MNANLVSTVVEDQGKLEVTLEVKRLSFGKQSLEFRYRRKRDNIP